MKHKRVITIIFLFSLSFCFAQELLVASYNMMRLGHGTKDYPTIASVVDDFDIVGAIEVMTPEGMERVKEYLPSTWSYVVSEKAVGLKAYKEYFGFFYNTDTVEIVKVLGFYPNIQKEFMRPPFAVQIKAKKGSAIFSIALAHIIYGDKSADRVREVSALNKVYTYFDNATGKTGSIIIAGDFNLESMKNFSALKALGVSELTSVKKTTLGQKSLSNDYDHIFIGKTLASKIIEADVYYWTSNWDTRKTVSDHFPVYCIINCK